MPEKFYTFPEGAQAYIQTAENEMAQVSYSLERVTETFGIRWYDICHAKKSGDNYAPQQVLYLAPHSDDMEISAGVTTRAHVQRGDHVQELLVTCGSAGRSNRGFSEKTMPIVRLWEAYRAAQIGEIQRLGVLHDLSEPEKLGLNEWFSDFPDGEYARLGVNLIRHYNPHILYSPHPDVDVDGHPDHALTGEIAQWAAGWGTETDFYKDSFPATQTHLDSWRRYAVWEASEKLSANYYTAYDPSGPYAGDKMRRIEVFQSQGGVNYAYSILSRDEYVGGMNTVGNNKHLSYESFNEIKSPIVDTPRWK